MSTKQPKKSVDKANALTVFLTGNELGALKPCGCSTGQLGGLEKRWAVLNSVPRSRRLIVDTGMFVEGDSQQDIIKFNIMIQALSLLDYDLLNLTKDDIAITEDLSLLHNLKSIFSIISCDAGPDANVPAGYCTELMLKDNPVAVTIASFDPNSGPIEQVEELFSPSACPQKVNILILSCCDAEVIAAIAEKGVVDCLVCPPESDEAVVVSEPNKRPLVVSVGRYGKYVGRLQIEPAEAKDELRLRFVSIPVTEDLRPSNTLVALYRDYQEWVKDANLLEEYPRYPLPDGLEYVGSESCSKPCHSHKYEYAKWSTKAHADAYATLVEANSHFDPECVVCHVVGMQYESGFISERKTAHLKNVGCENCHGPGSAHIKSMLAEDLREPMSDCTECHTPEHSAGYQGKEEQYFKKIVHWREPNEPNSVKNKRSSGK
ncbi:MAG: multiheme c-type cytochrome [Planctomycetota bacterium]|jgi:hypothetical protein